MAQIPCLSKDRHGEDRPDPRQRLQADEVRLRGQPRDDVRLELFPTLTERAIFLEHHAKH